MWEQLMCLPWRAWDKEEKACQIYSCCREKEGGVVNVQSGEIKLWSLGIRKDVLWHSEWRIEVQVSLDALPFLQWSSWEVGEHQATGDVVWGSLCAGLLKSLLAPMWGSWDTTSCSSMNCIYVQVHMVALPVPCEVLSSSQPYAACIGECIFWSEWKYSWWEERK